MPVKRPLESDSAATPAAKKLRKGFRVGPQNLPDGPWKRKVDKIKKNLIHKAKVKKAYKKIKAAEQASSKLDPVTSAGTEDGHGDAEPPSPQLHPERQAMLDNDEEEQPEPPSQPQSGDRPRRRKQHPRKPGYFDKASADAERKKAEAEARAQEIERRNEERNRKITEREKFRKAMAKARKPGRDGQRRLGRESGLLLEKVKKIVGETK
ncbi:uncharacterized protein F4807DRAFT_114825 [Annulohypoxylon truncatum]|uniref:uncharacterized protein n=1 Tax=Annulohypoxylon truncatum TaxID=327061 RepID=UPI002007CDAE|nr:uncharacterized protein F4807DRAFT_114825 [Annulohypoxylon truncatum]KAI1214117.1 hypothetical protein F4807DRAFT_114825 [Annulohypoxylon truncatum]